MPPGNPAGYQTLPTQQPRTPVAAPNAPAAIDDQKKRLQGMLARRQLQQNTAAAATPAAQAARPAPGTTTAQGASGQPMAIPQLPTAMRSAPAAAPALPPKAAPAAPALGAGPKPANAFEMNTTAVGQPQTGEVNATAVDDDAQFGEEFDLLAMLEQLPPEIRARIEPMLQNRMSRIEDIKAKIAEMQQSGRGGDRMGDRLGRLDDRFEQQVGRMVDRFGVPADAGEQAAAQEGARIQRLRRSRLGG